MIPASTSAWLSSGMWTVTSPAAASRSTPVGAPSSARRITPPAGSGVVASSPAVCSAPWLTSRPWWSCAHSATRRPGATRSRSSAVGQRPHRSTSQPNPSSHASGSVNRPWAAPMSAIPSSSESAAWRSTWRAAIPASARCRCASVRPGIATWSGSSTIRSVSGSARVSRYTSEPANATRPSRIPIASTHPKPSLASSARVAIRPVTSASRGIESG